MLLDIVILPPIELRQKIAKELKKNINNYSAIFMVDNKKLIPHLSLWHVKTSKNHINKLTKELQKIIKNQKPIKITSTKFIASEKESGVIEFIVSNNKSLVLLQKKVFKKTYPLKIGIMPPFKIFGLWTGEKLKQAKKYGRPMGFEPHFTMGLLKNKKDAIKIAEKMKKTKFSFSAKEIYICEVNNWWQVVKIIKKIDFI